MDLEENDDSLNNPRTKTMQRPSPLEMEDSYEQDHQILENDEIDSLVRDTTSSIQRRHVTHHHLDGSSSLGSGGRVSYMRGLLRSNLMEANYSWKQVLLLAGMTAAFALFLSTEETNLRGDDYNIQHYKGNPHQSSFAKPSNKPPVNDGDLPVYNVGHAVPSLSVENVDNEWGHYFHNPFFSPYHNNPKYPEYWSDPTYLNNLENEFHIRRQKATEQYGQWQEPDFHNLVSPHQHYDQYEYRDVPANTWPSRAWQRNTQFQKQLVRERKALVERVRRGIYNEYGYDDTQDPLAKKMFGVVVDDVRVTSTVSLFMDMSMRRRAFAVSKPIHAWRSQDFRLDILPHPSHIHNLILMPGYSGR